MQMRAAARVTCANEELHFLFYLKLEKLQICLEKLTGMKLFFQNVDFMESKYKSKISNRNLISELRMCFKSKIDPEF